jgi:hypothetical protein
MFYANHGKLISPSEKSQSLFDDSYLKPREIKRSFKLAEVFLPEQQVIAKNSTALKKH